MVSIIFATKNEVIGRLRMAGLNMKQFAVGAGYEPDTVRKVVRAGLCREQPDAQGSFGAGNFAKTRGKD